MKVGAGVDETSPEDYYADWGTLAWRAWRMILTPGGQESADAQLAVTPAVL